MPIYEYECNRCCCRFELKQRYDEEPVATCPECRGTARRMFHPAPILFKGSGFYITDSRKDGDRLKEAGKEPERKKGELAGKEEGKGK